MRRNYETAGRPVDTDRNNDKFIGTRPFTHGYMHPEDLPAGVISGTNPLGDPITFSTYLIGQIVGNPAFSANFNLDADRGFGYLCWDWVRSKEDPRRNKRKQQYDAPVTAPEGATNEWRYPVPAPQGQSAPPQYPTPLELRYLMKIARDRQ